VLAAELGEHWRERFDRFDERPAAAASIGQVHRAVWRCPGGGLDVAVKVQYPGVREAMLADVRAFSVASRAAALVARGVALPPLVTELRTRLLQELDYRREAANQQRFAPAYRHDDPDDDSEAVVP